MQSVVSEWGRFRPILRSPRCGGGLLRNSTQTPLIYSTQPGAAARSSQTKRRMLYYKPSSSCRSSQPQLGFHLRRPVGTIGPHLVAGIGFVQNLIKLLAIVDGSIGLCVAADDLVLAIDADVVLVAVEALVVLFGPACLLILLRVLSGLFFPTFRRLARFDRFVLFPGVVLLGRVDDGGIDNLPATGDVPLRI